MQSTIIQNEKDGQLKYSSWDADTDTLSWSRIDWYALFLWTARRDNYERSTGILHDGNLDPNDVDYLLWQVAQRERHALAPSRRVTPKKRKFPSHQTTDKGSAVSSEAADSSQQASVQDFPWKCEVLNPRDAVKLSAPEAEAIDMDHPWWKMQFVHRALKMVKAAKRTEQHDANDDGQGVQGEGFEAFAWNSELKKPDLGTHPDTPNHVIEPDAEAVEAFKEQQRWLDNVKFQRDYHESACQQLGIANADMPRIEGMRLGTLLKL